MRLILSMLLLAVLVGCGVNPKQAAEAEEILTRARVAEALGAEEVADREEARRHVVEMNLTEELEKAEREALWTEVLVVVGWAGAGGLVVLLLGMGIGGAIWAVGRSTAVSVEGVVRSMTISADEATGQYPLLLSYVGRGKFRLANGNLMRTMDLDTREVGDQAVMRLIKGSEAVKLAAVVTRNARMSEDATGVACWRPSMEMVETEGDGVRLEDRVEER